MIGEDIKTEVSLEELRRMTWDYSTEGIVGSYHGELIRQYMWEVKECGGISPFIITRCNVAEGWVEYLEVGNPRAKSMPLILHGLKRDENGDPIKTKLSCKVVVDLLTAEGNVIVTLS